MCEACNPMCGDCKPAEMIVLICPECRKGTALSRTDCLIYLELPFAGRKKALEKFRKSKRLVCGECGAELIDALKEHIKPLPCIFNGVICGYPCGKHERERLDNTPKCTKMVPLGKISMIKNISS